ncbi:cell division initiation protein [Candidatus Kryptobacter tengchongensis]|uniref:Cell division initiation protein n=2 Tax=Pseudomonadati TaxID=3379134 RepID=A0A656CYH6_KRYT1|nr:DivIVA domain-containing protein [Candidatus Kryptobacter tengchongensis]CUS87475.1 cell division initiation protein [Candidatus Kryptobacter tengchongensis]CUS98837.1 cell division initiation protein [Candidatus Kryptobacter tengchongensis]CUT01421.1 cell division initiation protein [Candidatus Kryptobacter tengchongensis]CUU09542.1 cell division initiation protein [Candidatus Kryptobacter tengchongensis]
MKFTPLAIKKQQFKKSLRGYNIEEVRVYLEMLAGEYENLLQENKELKEKIAMLETEISTYKQIEKNLHLAVTQAQETATKTLENAKKQAELLIKEAELKAKESINKAKLEIAKIENEIQILKNEKERILSELKNFLLSELEKLNLLEPSAKIETQEKIEEKIKLDDIIKNLEQ